VLKECTQTDRVGRMLLDIALVLPAGLNDTRQGASEAQVTCNGTLEILLPKGDAPLSCRFTWTNHARDQRTRLVLPWRDADVEGETWSDTGFAFSARKNVLAEYPTQMQRREMPPVVQPSLSTIVARPFVIHHRALQEYEVIRDRERHLLAITLVRSVGWMSRRDLVTRGVGAGPDLSTPEAQCLITDTFDFTLSCLAPDASPTDALMAARSLRRPVVKLRGTGKSGVTPITLADARIEVSSVRRVRSSDGTSTLELRLWNPLAEPLATGLAAGDWMAVRADGTPSSLPIATIAPFSLLTLRQRTFA
jgi:alpha-mannosidase